MTARAAEAPELEISIPVLREKAKRVRFLFAQQASLTAAKQEVTRELNQLIMEGNAVVDFKDSEKLIELASRSAAGPERRRRSSGLRRPQSPPPRLLTL